MLFVTRLPTSHKIHNWTSVATENSPAPLITLNVLLYIYIYFIFCFFILFFVNFITFFFSIYFFLFLFCYILFSFYFLIIYGVCKKRKYCNCWKVQKPNLQYLNASAHYMHEGAH